MSCSSAILLDGGRLQLHAAAGRAVGLGQDQGNLKTGGVELRQRHTRRIQGYRQK